MAHSESAHIIHSPDAPHFLNLLFEYIVSVFFINIIFINFKHIYIHIYLFIESHCLGTFVDFGVIPDSEEVMLFYFIFYLFSESFLTQKTRRTSFPTLRIFPETRITEADICFRVQSASAARGTCG